MNVRNVLVQVLLHVLNALLSMVLIIISIMVLQNVMKLVLMGNISNKAYLNVWSVILSARLVREPVTTVLPVADSSASTSSSKMALAFPPARAAII